MFKDELTLHPNKKRDNLCILQAQLKLHKLAPVGNGGLALYQNGRTCTAALKKNVNYKITI